MTTVTTLPHPTSDDFQITLETLRTEYGMAAALEYLFSDALATGYLDDRKLNGNLRFSWPDPETGVTFRTQINYARHGYTPAPPDPLLHCPICIENAGTPGKELLRIFEFNLNGTKYFAQLTPFPLFSHHFVIIRRDPVPMMMNRESLEDLVAFLDRAPGYTCCSNSDVEWAGASILKHHHYQVFKGLHLPMMDASTVTGCTASRRGISTELIDFPMACIRIAAPARDLFVDECTQLIETWKAEQPGKNTCNLVMCKKRNRYEGYILFRNPDHRTPTNLRHIKSEGVGVIEAAGEGIYPVPESDELLRHIERNGLQVIKDIIRGNNPVKDDQHVFFKRMTAENKTINRPVVALRDARCPFDIELPKSDTDTETETEKRNAHIPALQAESNPVLTVADGFRISGTPVSAEPYGSGHINDTYLITVNISESFRSCTTGRPMRASAGVERNVNPRSRYILQRINKNVFTNPEKLMANISRVTAHLRTGIVAEAGDPDRECLTLVPTHDGTEFLRQDGNWWRMYRFVESAESFDKAETPEHVYRAGRLYGRFQAMLADLPGPALHETIPGFHDLPQRLMAFSESMKCDPLRRLAAVSDEIAFVRQHADALCAIHRQGGMPVRITHNDTKINNVLLYTDGSGGCVIDLDTVMNGYVHFDYGDALRTVTNTGAEDEADVRNVSMDPDLFTAYTEGYLEYAAAFLTPLERHYLPLAGPMMTFMIGLRFLTDYLDGDTYFKTDHPEQNLVRARAQFALVESMLGQKGFMKAQVLRTTVRTA